ncbi:MAG: hypothetical protein M3032_01995 [Verrucomicrobiota bacterium]|nr:hypothetical protein [Verrucomicrobiota bacterium]
MKIKIYTCSLLVLFTAAAANAQSLGYKDDQNIERPNEKSILISWVLDFTGQTTADGTSTVAGAFSDEASRHEDFTVKVNSSGTEATVTGTILIHGTKGDLTEQFVGKIPLGPNPTLIEGNGIFTGGTGAYAGVSGHATFEGTVDFATGHLVGVTEGKVAVKH